MPKYTEFTVGLVIFLFLFFSFFLFFYQKGNRLSKNLLGIFFLSQGLAVSDVFLMISGSYAKFPQFAFILNSLPLVYGPLLMLLTKSVMERNYQLRKKDFLHFLPYVIFFLLFIFLFHAHSLDYKKEFLRRASSDPGAISVIVSFLIFTVIGGYILWCFQRIQSYRKQIKEEVSNVDKINLGWLQMTLFGFAAIMLLTLLIQLLITVLPEYAVLNILLFILLVGMLLFIMSAIIRGLKSDVIFATSFETYNKKNPPGKVFANVDEEKLNRLKNYMNSEKPFLDPSLSLKELANKLGLPSRELSILINQGTEQPFFDFVNSYRIKFAQNKIQNAVDAKYTILEAMFASGFNSKSSFNTAFKKQCGLTPTQWKNIKR